MKKLADYDPALVASVESRLDHPTSPADQLLHQIYNHFYQCYDAQQTPIMPAELIARYETLCPDDATFPNAVEITAHLAYYDVNHPTPNPDNIPQNPPDYNVWAVIIYAILSGLGLLYSGRWLGMGIMFVVWIVIYFLSVRIWPLQPKFGSTLLRTLLVLIGVSVAIQLLNTLI